MRDATAHSRGKVYSSALQCRGKVYIPPCLIRRILFDKIELTKGLVVENVVAQMLLAAGHKLYFYSNSSRSSSDDRMEIDFLVAKHGLTRRHNISPVEVKSGRSYAYESLSKFRKKYAAFLDVAYVLHVKDVAEKDGALHLPLYMAPLIVAGTDKDRWEGTPTAAVTLHD